MVGVICSRDATEWLRDDVCPDCGHPQQAHPSIDLDAAGCQLCELLVFLGSIRTFAAAITEAVNEMRADQPPVVPPPTT